MYIAVQSLTISANTTLPAEDEDVVPFGMDFGDRRPLSQLVDILLPQFLSILRNHLFLSDLFISKYLNVHSAGVQSILY